MHRDSIDGVEFFNSNFRKNRIFSLWVMGIRIEKKDALLSVAWVLEDISINTSNITRYFNIVHILSKHICFHPIGKNASFIDISL